MVKRLTRKQQADRRKKEKDCDHALSRNRCMSCGKNLDQSEDRYCSWCIEQHLDDNILDQPKECDYISSIPISSLKKDVKREIIDKLIYADLVPLDCQYCIKKEPWFDWEAEAVCLKCFDEHLNWYDNGKWVGLVCEKCKFEIPISRSKY